MRHRLVLMTLTLLILAGCGDKRILLNYVPDAAASKPAEDAPAVTVFAFRDARGDESDGNPYRVGGVYGGYGNRLSTVLAEKPVMPTLVDALAAGFRARGVPAQAVADREFRAGDSSVTGYALGGELRNFSTEARFTNSAHISASFGSMRPTARSRRRRRSLTVSGPSTAAAGSSRPSTTSRGS